MACDLLACYDENLMENEFFQTLQKDYMELFLKAISEGCIICVPRIGSLTTYLLTLEDFLRHILLPMDELPESHFRSLCGIQVKINNRIITVDHGAGRQISIHILFQETFYTEDGLKYEVLCVEEPFEVGINSLQNSNKVTMLKTLRECLELLWTESGTLDTKEQIDKEISDFLKKNADVDSNSSLQDIKDSVSALFIKGIHVLLKNSNIKKKYETEKHMYNNLKIAVETYMQHCIYKKIMRGITSCTACDDAHLNKIIRNFSDLNFKDFNINFKFYTAIPKARLELSRISCYSTTLGKVGCLQRMISALSELHIDKSVLNTDDLLQVLVFLIIKTNLPNWNAQLQFLKMFQLSGSNFDKHNFLITSLEAAITYVQSGIFYNPYSQKDPSQMKNEDFDCFQIHSLKKLNKQASTRDKTLYKLFQEVALGNLRKVKEIIETDCNNVYDYSSMNLCHPLCSCEKCSFALLKSISNVVPTVKSSDDQGLTALHIASIYGVPSVVEYLVEQGAEPNAVDHDGKTSVHYAALKGHQNVLLLLIHNNGNINVEDNSSNTPLHLCANNGHESCVKAIVYFSEYLGIKLKINHQNDKGDTPLHNASKWGYLNIVKILLEYGSDPTILNKRKFSSFDYAHNCKVLQLLKQNCQSMKQYIKIKPQNPALDLYEKTKGQLKGQTCEGIIPNSTDMMTKVEKVLHAVEKGDVNLVCFYMGINTSDFEMGQTLVAEPQELSIFEEKCHPLCICAKCGSPRSEENKSKNKKSFKKKSLNINICNLDGYTPLHIASKHGHLDLVKGFIRNNALVNVQTSQLLTPLMIACQNENLKVAKELLDHGCNVDMQDSKLNTALHYACYTGNIKLVEMLLKYEPNINLKNGENKTALHVAKEKTYIGLIQILKGGIQLDFNVL